MSEEEQEKSATKGGSLSGHGKMSPTVASLNIPVEVDFEQLMGRDEHKIVYYSAPTTDLKMFNEAGLGIEEERRPRSTHEDDKRVTEMYKDRDLYLAARRGELDDFRRLVNDVISRTDSGDILCRLSPSGNTFLHVAAKYDNKALVKYLAQVERPSLLAKNFNGETALHLAAKAGVKSMVEVLVELSRVNPEKSLLMAKNEMGNTALHEALLSGRDDSIAKYLINKNPRLSYELNNKGESAIYLAAKAGLQDCVSLILQRCTDEERLNELFKKKSPIKAAIEKKNTDVLDAIFKNKPRLIEMRDGDGRTPLHFAASMGHLEEASYLLEKCAFNATQRDKDGRLPIHLAAVQGHVDVIRLLLHDFSKKEDLLDSDFYEEDELLDSESRNILHVSAIYGRYNVFSFVIKNHDLHYYYLINMKDKVGNTPLHYASMYHHPKIVNALTWKEGVDTKAVNNDGESALDVCQKQASDFPQLKQRLTWAALKAASVPRHFSNKKVTDKSKKIGLDDYKERVNTLLLVATLVATVTFAAGFTMPGGYISSETSTDLGMATMLRNKGFHVFVFCDTMAMYSSILVVTALIWAQLGDTTLVIAAVELAAPLLGVALIMMSMAFTAGVIIVCNLRWLQIVVLAMAVSFIAFLLLLLLPLCAPIDSRGRMLRYISYYPFHLLILVSSKEPPTITTQDLDNGSECSKEDKGPIQVIVEPNVVNRD